MTEVVKLTGATSISGQHWKAINWQKVKAEVKDFKCVLQRQCANKVKALQWILSHSYSAKLLAVRRVTENKGAKTPGVDGKIWNTPAQKMKGALTLIRKGIKPFH